MMELYQREDQSAGRLPADRDPDPVFFAFYWVLLERRDAPGAVLAWIQDLSSKDPFFRAADHHGRRDVRAEYKLNPTPADPVQAKVFASLIPMVMSVIRVFPAGLVLYWVTNTVLSIAQQWNINRRI